MEKVIYAASMAFGLLTLQHVLPRSRLGDATRTSLNDEPQGTLIGINRLNLGGLESRGAHRHVLFGSRIQNFLISGDYRRSPEIT